MPTGSNGYRTAARNHVQLRVNSRIAAAVSRGDSHGRMFLPGNCLSVHEGTCGVGEGYGWG